MTNSNSVSLDMIYLILRMKIFMTKKINDPEIILTYGKTYGSKTSSGIARDV